MVTTMCTVAQGASVGLIRGWRQSDCYKMLSDVSRNFGPEKCVGFGGPFVGLQLLVPILSTIASIDYFRVPAAHPRGWNSSEFIGEKSFGRRPDNSIRNCLLLGAGGKFTLTTVAVTSAVSTAARLISSTR